MTLAEPLAETTAAHQSLDREDEREKQRTTQKRGDGETTNEDQAGPPARATNERMDIDADSDDSEGPPEEPLWGSQELDEVMGRCAVSPPRPTIRDAHPRSSMGAHFLFYLYFPPRRRSDIR